VTSRFVPARTDQSDSGLFADLLLRHRLAAGLSQRELAGRSGLSERAVRDLERGATAQPRRTSAQAIAAALGLHGDDLTRFLATALGTSDAVPLSVSTMDDLVGRGRELRQLADLVTGGRHRMVTVTGAGGVGKSRLVAELVAALRRQTTMDIRTLDLSGLAEPELVREAIAQALDTESGSRLAPVERAAAALRGRRVLLVLDRFEHLLPAAPTVADLVRRCPGLSVLITSQRPLRAGPERQFRLEPLTIAAAVELFVRRAAAVTRGFTLTGDNTGAVTEICRAVHGLPLAVELAAARTRLMTPAELAERFHRQLRLLAGGAADLPARHRSLRATIEASLEVITADARNLFAWLGAFAGGAQRADIEAVVAAFGRDTDWLPAALGDLVDTSLVSVRDPDPRYVMLDAMAELAREHLAARADRVGVERAAALRFLERVRHFAQQPHNEDRRDAGNVRAAAQYAIARDITLLDPITLNALRTYYEVTGRPDEGRQLFTAAGDAGAPIAYVHAGRFARLQADLTEAARLGQLAMSRLGEHHIQTRMHLGAVATEAGDSKVARSHFRAVLAAARKAKDLRLIGGALNNLGALSAETGRLEDAERLFTAALKARRCCGDSDHDIGDCLHNLAEVALETGRYEHALTRIEQAPPNASDRLTAHAATTRALALVGLGRIGQAREAVRLPLQWLAGAREQRRYAALIETRCSVVLAATGETAQAARHLCAAVPVMLDSTPRDHDEAATWLEAHARLLAGRDPDAAARLLGAAHSLRRRSSRLVAAATVSTSDAAAAKCRKALGDKRFEQEYGAGSRIGAAALTEVCTRVATPAKITEVAWQSTA